MKRYITAFVLSAVLVTAGCPKGTVTHKITVAQHDFRFTVQAFQDAEIAEHAQGAISDEVHVRIQQIVQKVALAGVDLDKALAANASTSTIKTKVDIVYNLLDSLDNDGLLFIKDAQTKANLELALEAVKAIVANAETLLAERGEIWILS